MKPHYAWLSLLCIASGAFAQQAPPLSNAMELTGSVFGPDGYIHPSMIAEMNRGGGGDETIFYEDFANGMDGNNGVGAWTVSGDHGNIWKRAVAGPNGYYVGNATTARIQSATVSNGYMLFNSDSANATWVGNTPTALPSAEFTDWDGSLESPLLDLSATPNVRLEYQQRLRWCCGSAPQLVEVSTDGGFSWPHAFDASGGAHMNQTTATQLIKINLTSAIVDDPTNVKFRFRHDGEAGTSVYHWQLDDVRLVVQPDHDLRLDYGLISNVANGNEYGRIPASQIPNNTLIVGGGYNNFGTQAHNNVELEVAITGPGNAPVLTETIAHGALAFEDTVNASVAATAPELPVGVYNVNFKVRSDEEPEGAPLFADNTVPTRRFSVTETVYSLDNIGNHATNQEYTLASGTNSFTNNADGVMFMTQYNILAPFTATGIEVILHTGQGGTQSGGNIVAALRDSVDVFQNLGTTFVPELSFTLGESEFMTVTNQHLIAGRISLPFTQPVTLEPGNYVAGVELYGGQPDTRIRILDDLTVPQPGWTSFMYLPSAAGSGSANRIWSNGNSYAIRLLTVTNVGVQEHGTATMTSLFPNPTNGDTRLTYSLNGPAAVSITILDITGKQVMSFNEGTLGAGEHQFRFDATLLQEGAYMYVLRTGDRESAGRFVVVR